MKRTRPARTTLSEPAREALAAAVIVGDPIELPLLAALGVKPATLDALFDAGLLSPLGATDAQLADAVDRDAAVATLAWSERRRWHERLGGLLAPRPDRWLKAARHFAAACNYPEARRIFVRLAERACHEQRYAEALEALDEGLRIWPADEDAEARLRIVREMVRCARNCGRNDMAIRGLRETLEMAGSDPALAMDTHQQLGDLALFEMDFPAARRHFESAATLAEQLSSPDEAARCWLGLANFLGDQMRPKEARKALGHAFDLVKAECSPALRSELLAFDGLLCAMAGEAKAARALVDEALELAVKHQLNAQATLAYRRQANIREYCSDYAGERDAHLKAISMCRKQGAKDSEQTCLVCLSYVFFRTGDWKRALEMTRKVSADSEAHPALKAGAIGVRALVASFRGEQRQTLSMLAEASLGLRRYGVLSLEFHLLWAEAFAQQAAGELDAAAATYGRLLDLWEDTEDVHDVVPGAMCGAALFADRGDVKRLAQATDILHAVVAANDNQETRAGRAAVLGEAAIAARDWTVAITHLASARDGYDRVGTPIERALVRVRLVRAFVVAGREREAAEERETGAAIARQLGMRPVLAAFTPSAQPSGSGAVANEALTGRQRDVLRLLAAGLTNKEAADRLSLSPRTVEMHVASLLDRLNCRTRSEAIRRSTELGLL
jgi:DNA-binding CsgD family transcriptional regulator/tetratricopeptide (TPR) repeat protein